MGTNEPASNLGDKLRRLRGYFDDSGEWPLAASSRLGN